MIQNRPLDDKCVDLDRHHALLSWQAAGFDQRYTAALDKQHAREDSSPAGKGERDTAYTYVSKSFRSRVNSRLAASEAVKRTYDQVNQLRSGLASDPVKDSAGELLISPVTPIQCGLPVVGEAGRGTVGSSDRYRRGIANAEDGDPRLWSVSETRKRGPPALVRRWNFPTQANGRLELMG